MYPQINTLNHGIDQSQFGLMIFKKITLNENNMIYSQTKLNKFSIQRYLFAYVPRQSLCYYWMFPFFIAIICVGCAIKFSQNFHRIIYFNIGLIYAKIITMTE